MLSFQIKHYFRAEEEKLLAYSHDPAVNLALKVIHEDPWAGGEKEFESLRKTHEDFYEHHGIAYLNPEPVPGGGERIEEAGFHGRHSQEEDGSILCGKVVAKTSEE